MRWRWGRPIMACWCFKSGLDHVFLIVSTHLFAKLFQASCYTLFCKVVFCFVGSDSDIFASTRPLMNLKTFSHIHCIAATTVGCSYRKAIFQFKKLYGYNISLHTHFKKTMSVECSSIKIFDRVLFELGLHSFIPFYVIIVISIL